MGAAASIEGEFDPNGTDYVIQADYGPAAGVGESPAAPRGPPPASAAAASTPLAPSAPPPAATNTYQATPDASQLNSPPAIQQKINPVNQVQAYEAESETDQETDINPLDILFQFIPYYGQGDPSNDSIVRSTLSGLAVEDIDNKDEYGNTLLLVACQYRCEDLARIILNKGADPNSLNTSGACSLHFTCYRESASRALAKVLLQNGANPEVAEYTYGCTPLHYCAGTGDVDFCKMLISYGASVSTVDLYNYTCVDYAREAGMQPCAHYLQSKLLDSAGNGSAFRTASGRTMSQMNMGAAAVTGYGATPSSKVPLLSSKGGIVTEGDWQVQTDANTGQKYYTHMGTGECLWEKEYRAKVKGSAGAKGSAPEDKYLLLGEETPGYTGSRAEAKSSKGESKGEAASTPRGQQGQGQGTGLSPTRSMAKMEARPGTAGGGMDAGMLQGVLAEAKRAAEEQIEQDQQQNRALISAKDGKIAKLEAVVETLIRENEKNESECTNLKETLSRMGQSGDQAMQSSEAEVGRLRSELEAAKSESSATAYQLSEQTSKLTALQDTLQNMNSNDADRVAAEQQAEDLRAAQQREREAKHVAEIKSLNQAMADERMKFAQEFAAFKMQKETAERDSQKKHEALLSGKDREVERLNREVGDTRSKAAEELSNAEMLIEVSKRRAAEAEQRAEEAVGEQRQMVGEIEEARQVQQYNAQLHRDLGREQQARKRLHNEMEDMKGRIRVYTRVRPMGRSEVAKNCKEAVSKDGKLSVLVQGEGGAKKVFDFDHVFGGDEGNTQSDVFKDTKHLCMSVVDGYNVCIFAYGQTGSGKTFTMIGAGDISSCLRANGDFDELAGITPRAVAELFRLLNERHAQVEYEVEVQMFQLYRDGLDDLLVDGKKKKREDGDKNAGKPLKIVLAEHSSTGLVQVEGANSMIAKTPADVIEIFTKGKRVTEDLECRTAVASALLFL
jgi:hypothetical protein